MTRDIKQTRDRLGLSTAELAKLVGVGYRTAHHWMKGGTVPEPVWRLLEVIPVAFPDGAAIFDGAVSCAVQGALRKHFVGTSGPIRLN